MRDSAKTNYVLLMLLSVASVSSFAETPLRDPTRPDIAVQSNSNSRERPSYVVNAIIVSAERRVAIVNGKRVGVGDSLGDASLVAIEKDHLVLETNGKRVTIGLNE